MKKIFFIIFALFIQTKTTFASLHEAANSVRIQRNPPEKQGGIFSGLTGGNPATDAKPWYDFMPFSEHWFILSIVFTLLTLLVLWIFIVSFIRVCRFLFEIYYYKNLVYMKITLPRADSKLDKEKETKKDFKEKIGIMSMFYKSAYKISEASFKETVLNWLFRHSKISMELIYDKWEVSFYVCTYKNFVNLISQQITSTYNDAEITIITDRKKYIDLEEKWYHLRGASIGKELDDVFPIKTYKYLEDDPLNNFTNVFGGLWKDDKAVYSIILKPESSKYNKKAKEAAGLVSKGKYKAKRKNPLWFLSFLWNPLVALVEGPEDMVWGNTAPGASEWDAYKIFNQAETEAQKAMGEAAGQPMFKSSIIVLVASKDYDAAGDGVRAIISASSVFNDEYNNTLDNPQQIEDFWPIRGMVTYLRFVAFKYKLVKFFQNASWFSTDEVSSLYHFPDVTYNRSPLINWSEYKKLSPPHDLPTMSEPCILKEKNEAGVEVEKPRTLWGFPVYRDGVLLGWNEYRNKKIPIYFARSDRGRHQYVIGKSGWGKSVFIGSLARQDTWNGDGVCVIDPHGDLVEDVLSYVPKERAKDVIIFDPADDERPMGLNMLEVVSTDPDARKREMDRAAMDATEIFIKIFGDEIFGPRIQHYFRNGCLTLMEDEEDGGTLIDVPRLFTDDAFLKYKTSKVKNPVVKAFWDHEYANTGDREKQEMIPYFSSKFGPFITNTTIRNIIWQPKSAFNIRQVMDTQKILLVNLSKGKVGALNAQLLGLIFVSKINMAAMSRADQPEEERKDFFLYVDEFQNFATETFGEILSEARKYHLALIMAHQFIAQIGWSGAKKWDKPSIKDAVFGNAGTIMSFKVGAEDAEYLEKEYAPVLSQQDIIGIAKYTTYCKLNISNASSRPFDIKTIWDTNHKSEKLAAIVKEYSRKKYGRKKKYVDMEIEARLGIQT